MVRRFLPVCLCVALIGLFYLSFTGAGRSAPTAVATPAVLPNDARAANPVLPRIGATAVVGQITGRDSPNDTARRWDIHGTDLGHMFWHRGKLHMVFGDTFGAGGLGGKHWRSNTMARIADSDPRNGFPFESMIVGRDGMAKELLPSLKLEGVEKTVIPTSGVSVGTRMYLHYMSVRRWGEPGHWTVRRSGIAYSEDDGQTWATPAKALWPSGSGFEQVAFVRQADVLYTFGIPEGRFGGVRLRQVAAERILERDAYHYWNGNEWVVNAADAVTIVSGPVGELSVAWSPANQRWLMMYLEPERRAVVLRTAPALTGPWSDAKVVVTGKDYPGGLYAPYIVPGSDIDADLYYTMSRWEPYNVFLMRTTLDWTGPAVASGSPSDSRGGGADATPAAAPR